MVTRESVTEGLDAKGTQDIPDSEQQAGAESSATRRVQMPSVKI